MSIGSTIARVGLVLGVALVAAGTWWWIEPGDDDATLDFELRTGLQFGDGYPIFGGDPTSALSVDRDEDGELVVVTLAASTSVSEHLVELPGTAEAEPLAVAAAPDGGGQLWAAVTSPATVWLSEAPDAPPRKLALPAEAPAGDDVEALVALAVDPATADVTIVVVIGPARSGALDGQAFACSSDDCRWRSIDIPAPVAGLAGTLEGFVVATIDGDDTTLLSAAASTPETWREIGRGPRRATLVALTPTPRSDRQPSTGAVALWRTDGDDTPGRASVQTLDLSTRPGTASAPEPGPELPDGMGPLFAVVWWEGDWLISGGRLGPEGAMSYGAEAWRPEVLRLDGERWTPVTSDLVAAQIQTHARAMFVGTNGSLFVVTDGLITGQYVWEAPAAG